VNDSAGLLPGLTAHAEILNLDGSLTWERSASLDSQEDSVVAPFKLEMPPGLTPVHFIRLRLSRGGQILSDNLYWRGSEEGNLQALRALPKVKLAAATRAERRGSRWLLTTALDNPSSQPAVMVRLTAVRGQSGDRILPALYADNYVTLMPGERRTIQTELEDADARGETPTIAVAGFNVGELATQ
jgi:hypothetical protein